MRRPAGLLLSASLLLAPALGSAQTSERQYLSGTDKDHTVAWDFQVSGGRRAGEWSTIPVPSNWELHGFGTYKYGGPAPRPDEQGRYRHRFETPRAWRGQRVDLVFEGSMTDTEAWIDGKPVGPKHQGAFYEFRYDVTALVRFGARQRLEVLVEQGVVERVRQLGRAPLRLLDLRRHLPARVPRGAPARVDRARGDRRAARRRLPHGRLPEQPRAAAGSVTAQIETIDGQPVGAPSDGAGRRPGRTASRSRRASTGPRPGPPRPRTSTASPCRSSATGGPCTPRASASASARSSCARATAST